MELYYGKPEGNKIILSEDETTHLLKVRRAKIGDIVQVSDGEGNLFIAQFDGSDKHNAHLFIRETTKSSKKDFTLHIAIAPTKNIDRIEWFLEKAVETGIDEVTFLLCRHSERKEVKEERLNRVLIAAMKQSLKTFLPKINPMIPFGEFVKENLPATKLICAMSAGSNESFRKKYLPGNSLVALIGPEGDFNEEELELAVQAGFQLTTLGESRLRTETAALTVCTLFNFVNS